MKQFSVSGPISLPFAEAVEDGLICPFKVVVAVVTTEMLRRELEVSETVYRRSFGEGAISGAAGRIGEDP